MIPRKHITRKDAREIKYWLERRAEWWNPNYMMSIDIDPFKGIWKLTDKEWGYVNFLGGSHDTIGVISYRLMINKKMSDRDIYRLVNRTIDGYTFPDLHWIRITEISCSADGAKAPLHLYYPSRDAAEKAVKELQEKGMAAGIENSFFAWVLHPDRFQKGMNWQELTENVCIYYTENEQGGKMSW